MRTRRTALLVVLCALHSVAGTVACSDDKPPPPPAGDGPVTTAWRSAVGSDGAFAQTFDDSRWQMRNVAPVDLLAVACVGNIDGWVAGRKGTIARTRDGGRTWTSQDSHFTVDLRAIRFGDAKHGVVAGDSGALAITEDSGLAWQTITSPAIDSSVTFRGAAAAWSRLLYVVVGDKGTILRSADAGRSWTRSTLEGAGDLRAVASDPDGHRVLVVDSNGGIYASGDLAMHFTKEATAPAALDAIATSDDGMRSLAVGAGGVAFVSDGARTWTPASVGTTHALHAALATGGRYYAAGDQGTLLTSDDGVRWSRVELGTTANFYALEDL